MGARRAVVVCALAGALAAIACASGGDDGIGDFGDGGDQASSSSGTGKGSSTGSSSSGSGSTSSGSSGTSASSSASSSSGSSGGGEAGSGGGTSSGSGDDGGGSPEAGGEDGGGNAACGTPPDACTAGATSLGSIAGDETASPVTGTGATSEWLRVDLTEQDSSIVGHAMTFTGTLTSPPGVNYDLYAYLGSSVGDIQCTTPTGQSTTTGIDQVTFSWGETTGGVANGQDDSATVMLEVRWVSGVCTSAQSWSLSVHGN